MALEDPEITMTAFEPSLGELESEPLVDVGPDTPVVRYGVHGLAGEQEGWVDAPLEPQFPVDSHRLRALDGLSLLTLFPMRLASPTEHVPNSDLTMFANAVESTTLVFRDTVD